MSNPRSSIQNDLSRRDAIRRFGVAGGGGAAVVAPRLAEGESIDRAAVAHRALIDRLFAALNGGDLDQLDAFIAPDHVFHTCGREDPIVGRAALKALLADERTVEQSAPYALETVLANGEQAAVRWTRTGPTIDPETMLPTAGTTFVEGQFICRLRNGQLSETWNVSFARDSGDGDHES